MYHMTVFLNRVNWGSAAQVTSIYHRLSRPRQLVTPLKK